jgi:hypothetical protein
MTIRLAAIILAAITLMGCSTLDPKSFAPSPGEKDANINCISYNTLPTDVGVLTMSVDAGVVQNGELKVKCGENSVEFTNKRGIGR